MRCLILFAFGLIVPAVTMAAPTNCKITSTKTSFTATNCTAAERKLISAAQAKPTTQQVKGALDKLAGKQYLTINTICKLKRGRRKAARSLVERCYNRAGQGQRIIIRNALKNLGDIKACRGVKRLGQQIDCMIDQNNRILVPIIEDTLDAQETYVRGVKFIKKNK